jgi:phosphatidylserine decarboxylase
VNLSLRQAVERAFVGALSAPALSRVTARLSDLRVPRPILRALIRAYVRAYGVDLSEAAEPVDSYETFNAFFTRRLRDGAREVATEPGLVVSPADARLQSMSTVPADGRLDQIKGRTYAIAALLGDPEEAAAFGGGLFATLYLSPSMYHRFHSPVDGRVLGWRAIPGRSYPVNPLAVRNVEALFTVNERVVVTIESEMGPMAMVMVGAANVGRISLTFGGVVTGRERSPARVVLEGPIAVRRGQELGAFNLGSTIVLLAAEPRLQPAGAAVGELLRVGQPLWRRAGRPSSMANDPAAP